MRGCRCTQAASGVAERAKIGLCLASEDRFIPKTAPSYRGFSPGPRWMPPEVLMPSGVLLKMEVGIRKGPEGTLLIYDQ